MTGVLYFCITRSNPTFWYIKIQENDMKYVNFSWILSILWYTNYGISKMGGRLKNEQKRRKRVKVF